MSEQKSAETGTAPAKWIVPAWAGGIVGLGLLAFVFLYIFGDPRPRSVDETQIGGGASAIPDVIPNGPYYRLRAEYFPLSDAGANADPLGKAWIALFSDAVSRAGDRTVRLRLSHMKRMPLPRDDDGYLFIDSPIEGPALSAVTPFMLRNNDDNVEIRLDTERGDDARSGLFPSLLRSMGSASETSSGWVSIYAPGSSTGRQVLTSANAILPVRDFSGRVVGAVRIGVETRDGLLFSVDTSDQIVGRILGTSRGSAERIEALTEAVGNELPDSFAGEGGKSQLRQILEAVSQNPDPAACRNAIAGLSERAGISAADATALVYLARYDEAAAEDAICGDVQLTTALAASGIVDRVRQVAATTQTTEETKTAEKGAASAAKVSDNTASATGIETPSGRYVCLGLSGPRIAHHCKVLNEIAREWRGGAKFLHMTSSVRYIQFNTGLEEPTADMTYAASRFVDRRDLLIHIALSRVENIACFRMTRENPDYFEAVIVMREPGSRTARRVDVFQFAFDSDGTIGRIRRRAALPSDIDAARSLPENSRCRQEFLDPRRDTINDTVNRHWRLSNS